MTKRFTIGFGIGLLIFVALNLLSAHLRSDCGLLAVFGRDALWHRPPGPVGRSNFTKMVVLPIATISMLSSWLLTWGLESFWPSLLVF
jgi:hypothetical protein